AESLDAHRTGPHLGGRPAATENLQDVADGSTGRTGHKSNVPWKARQRPLPLRGKISQPGQFLLQLLEGQILSANALGVQLIDDEPIISSRWIDVEFPSCNDFQPILKLETQSSSGAAPDNGANLGLGILQTQIYVAGTGALQVRDFTGYPDRWKSF